ncbi:mucin-2-like [Homalodisca vitripennis]|uniref:mucin-2-like n=1 Tax=Homalodisca vitripennis TaxID=197043 RepID=UPI001EECC384|nr:mucin-2-like [Homalodisca vitripennis]
MVSIRHWPYKHFFFSLVSAALHLGAGGRVFSPRMDYDEWTPLGRGDPLKNDPTYDYVPPVLDRVNYWLEPKARTPDPPLTTPEAQVLLLGVAAPKKSPGKVEVKKPSQADSRHDNYDPLIHFINERKQVVSRVRPQYIPLQGGYLSYRAPLRSPYTMLIPPPPPPTPTTTVETTPVTTTTTTTTTTSTEGTTFATPEATASTITHMHKVLAPMIDINPSGQQSLSSSLLQVLLQNEMATSLQPPQPQPSTTPSTTPNPSLTTDPLFSHYKQPAEPLRGPMYLIIQGHSKVKTYGVSKLDKLSGLPIEDDNEVEDRRRRSRQVELEDLLPVEETLEAVVKDYVDNDSEGSGLKQLLAAVTSS